MKGPEGMPHIPSPEEALDRRAHEETQAAYDCVRIWGELEEGREPMLPGDKHTAGMYIEKLEWLKEHAIKQYEPAEKEALHRRADAYISRLKAM